MQNLVKKDIEAAVLFEIDKPLQIKKITSNPLKRGQVLIKILYSGICRSQLMEIQGLRGEDKWLPHLLGHEGSGVVEAVGEGVSKVKPGDDVILTWIKSEGLEADGAKYNYKKSVINSGAVTTFSNYSIVSENRVVKKPKNIPFDLAILFGCALPTGAGMVLNEINVKQNSKVAVIGLGGIGLSATLMLLAKKVTNLVAIDISEEKLKLVKSWGVSNCLNPSKVEIQSELNSLGLSNIDYCIESAGSINSIELGFSLIKKNGGELIFASHPPSGDKISIDPHELISGKSISGSWGGNTKPDRDFPIFSKLLLPSKTTCLESLIVKEYTLEKINVALSDLKNGKVFRPLIKMKH